MSWAPAPADVKDDLLLQIRCLLGKNKPELQTEWEEVDCSEIKPEAKADLLAALLLRLFRDTSDTDSVQSQPSSSRWPVATATSSSTYTSTCQELQGSCHFSRQATSFTLWLQPLWKRAQRAQRAQAEDSGVGQRLTGTLTLRKLASDTMMIWQGCNKARGNPCVQTSTPWRQNATSLSTEDLH